MTTTARTVLRPRTRNSIGKKVLAAIAAIALPLLVVVPISAAAAAPADAAPLSVIETRINDLVNPLGVDTLEAPVLSWKSASTARGVTQEAYQVRVATSEDSLGDGDVWDSTRVDSDQQLNIAYEGPSLESQTRYFWQVKVWDNLGNESAWSDAAWFETALDTTDWEADWIGGESQDAALARWSDYTVDADFTLTSGTAFGLYLRTSADTNNGYMWQLNDEIAGHPRLRPHVKVNGAWSTHPEVDLTTMGLPADTLKHRGTLSISLEGSTITTTVNGVEVSSITDATFAEGFVGPRTDVSTHEEVIIHSMSVTTPTETLYESDFANGVNPFNGGTTIVDGPEGGLLVKDQVNAVWAPESNLPLLRTDFATEAGKEIESARVYASAKGIYRLSLNGSRVGDDELAPGWTDFSQRIQYQTYDVTSQVSAGDNALGAWVGSGWYTGHIAWLGDKKYGDRNSVIAQLVITYTDGSTQVVATDDTWKTASGPIVSADLMMGETYDANSEKPGWDTAGFDDASWSPVWEDTPDSTAFLHPQTDNPVRVVQERAAMAQTEAPAGSYIYDFEQNLTGVVRVTLTGKAGQTVMLRHGEVLNKDGTLYTANLRSAKATDYYTFATDGTVTYTPRFTQHGFRYVEISGVTAPVVGDVTAEVFSSDLDQTGTFSTSNAMLNQLQSNIVWGQRGNFISVPTDTPARDERLGYTGDLNAFVGTATFNMDSLTFIQKWLKDASDTQKLMGTGAYPDSTPRGPNQLCCTSGTAWSDAGITVPWMAWQRYGNHEVVADSWDSMVWYMDYLAASFPDYVRVDGPFGDWLNLADDTPAGVLGTAYYAYDARLMSEMATLLGKDEEAAKYAELETAVTDAFVTNFVAADGTVTGNSQTAYALSLGLDLVPDELREAAGAKLVEQLASRDYHLSTGFVGTPWLMPALSGTGNWDTAYRLLLQDTIPSWGYEVASGATTMWERWDSIDANGNFGDPGMNSFNHYSFGAVGDWMYQNIGGISVDESGYKAIDIAPHPGGGLTEGNASLESVYGVISSSWTLDGSDFSLNTVIPTNATATVRIPANNAWAVTEQGLSLADAPGVEVVSSDGESVVVAVGSGSYEFEVNELAGSIGGAIDAAIAMQDRVDELLAGGDVTAEQASHLNTKIQDVVDSATSAINTIDTDRAAAIDHIADAIATVRTLQDWLGEQDADGEVKSELSDAAAGLDAQLTAIAVILSGLTVTVELGEAAAYAPGQAVEFTATLTNSGESPLTDLTATFAGDASWNAEPAATATIPSLEPADSVDSAFTATVPKTQLPGDDTLPVSVEYTYDGTLLTTVAAAQISVVSGISITSVTADPASVVPTSKSTVTATVANAGADPISGQVVVNTPDGWVAPQPSATATVEPGASLDVPVGLFVPTTLSQENLALPVEFVRDGVVFAEATVNLSAEVPVPPSATTVHDHIDLGDGTSEAAHNLTASSLSGTSVEAGLTRRYSGSSGPSSFEFDMVVPQDDPFVLTAIETFDGPRVKDYTIIVNDVVVQNRDFQRAENSIGTGNYQVLVDDPAAFSSTGTAHIVFEDVVGNYDPSIADAWTSSAPPDVFAPSVTATLDPSVPNGNNSWYTSDVSVTLNGEDEREGAIALEYRVDGAAEWTSQAESAPPITVTDDGEHVVEYRGTDEAGNTSDAASVVFKIDRVAPETTADVLEGDDNTASVVLTATDTHSGVATTQYQLDGGDWVDYAAPAVVVEGAGRHAVTYRSTDVAGTVEDPKSLTVQIDDTVAPVVTLSLPEAGANGWLGAGATATLAATDADLSVRSIEYRLGDGDWATYWEPVALPDGQYAIAFRATDAAGNVSAAAKQDVSVDGTAPAAWAWLATDGHLVSATSDETSGIARTEYSLDGTNWTAGLDALLEQNEAPTEVWVRAVDQAGNESEAAHLEPSDAADGLTVTPGEALHIEASGFEPEALVRVELHSDPVVLGEAEASALGAIALGVVVPETVDPGDHALVFVVETDGTTPPDPGGPGTGDPGSGGPDSGEPGSGGPGGGAGEIPVSVIANTGFDLWPGLVAAILVLLGGVALVGRFGRFGRLGRRERQDSGFAG